MVWEWGWTITAILIAYYATKLLIFFSLDNSNGLNARLKFFLLAFTLSVGLTGLNGFAVLIDFYYYFPISVMRTLVFIPLLVSVFLLSRYIMKTKRDPW